MKPFSFSEIQNIPSFDLKQSSFVAATDDCKLAYYPFVPTEPKALVIFYHGAGLYGNRIHQWIAKEIQDRYHIGCYIIDIRGHGKSEGARGDAPRIQTVWQDVSTMIDHVRTQHPGISLYLAGHSSGAGLLLNYAAWQQHKKVDGFILVAPYLGPLSGTLKTHTDDERKFNTVRSWVYRIAGMTNERLAAHIPAVYFNWPTSILQDDAHILTYYTYTMSCATTPYQTKTIFESIQLPTGIFIAAEDEQFIADALAGYADYIPEPVYRYTQEVKGAKHLSILLETPALIAQMIDRFEDQKKTKSK